MPMKHQNIKLVRIIQILFSLLLINACNSDNNEQLQYTKNQDGEKQIQNTFTTNRLSNRKLFPKFVSIDTNGTIFNSQAFTGKYIYVQFSKNLFNDEINITRQVLNKYSKRDELIILLVSEQPEKISHLLSPNDHNLILSKSYNEIRAILGAPICCDSFQLYDKNRNIIFSDLLSNNEDLVSHILMKYLDSNNFSIKNLIYIGLELNRLEWMKQIKTIINNNHYKYYLISLLTRVCSSCPSGNIIRQNNELKKLYNNSNIYNSAIVLHYTNQEIDSLEKHFEIKYPIIAADKILAAYWDKLIREYGEAELTNIVILISNDGTVLDISDPRCNCIDNLFKKVKDLVGE
jgi:hypothetical protein